MHIVFFSSSIGFGGGERYLTILLPILKMMGHDVDLVSSSPESMPELKDFFSCQILVKEPDVIVFNGNGALYKWGLKYKDLNCSRIFVMHSSLYDNQSDWFRRLARPFILKFYLRKFDLIIRVAKNCLPNNFFKKIATVYNGVNLPPALASKRDDFSQLNIAIIGSLNNNKNQQLAINALSRLPKNIKLKILGAGPSDAMLKSLCKKNNISDRVIFFGYQNDPFILLDDVHALVITSKIEAFPFVALEAMSLGIPVISSNVGGISELIHHYVNGLLYEANSLSGLCESISKIYSSEKFRSLLAKESRITIENNFTSEIMAKNFIKVISDIV